MRDDQALERGDRLEVNKTVAKLHMIAHNLLVPYF